MSSLKNKGVRLMRTQIVYAGDLLADAILLWDEAMRELVTTILRGLRRLVYRR